MEGAEFDALVADIKKNGLHYPIFLYEGKILDGRNRYRACLELGWEPATRNCDHHVGDPAGFVISRNIHRRHLTAKQRRELIAKLLKAAPEKSNRQIAETAKADDKTVATVRRDLEATAEIPQLEKTVGADGKARKQPTKKMTIRQRRERRKAKREAESERLRKKIEEDQEAAKAKAPKHDSRIITPKLADRVGRFAHDLILSERLLARELADIIMLPGVRERLSADLTNGLALLGNDASSERTL
jgi:hypothetical protein